MPIRRSRPSRADLAAAQELQRAGLIPRIPAEWLETSSALNIQIAPPYANVVCQLPNGSTFYAILARLLSRRGGSILEDFDIASARDSDLRPLYTEENEPYRFGRAFDFPWDEVLNHRIEKGLRFHRRGDLAEGWLLAVGHRPIPGKYPDRMAVALDTAFTDQFGDHQYARAEAFVERSARREELSSQPRKSPGLFEPLVSEARVGIYEKRAGTVTGPAEVGRRGSLQARWPGSGTREPGSGGEHRPSKALSTPAGFVAGFGDSDIESDGSA